MIPEVPFPRHILLGHTKPFAADTLGFVLACAKAGLPMAWARIAFRDFLVLLEPEVPQLLVSLLLLPRAITQQLLLEQAALF